MSAWHTFLTSFMIISDVTDYANGVVTTSYMMVRHMMDDVKYVAW